MSAVFGTIILTVALSVVVYTFFALVTNNNRLRVIRLGSIIMLAVVLLFVIFIFGTNIL